MKIKLQIIISRLSFLTPWIIGLLLVYAGVMPHQIFADQVQGGQGFCPCGNEGNDNCEALLGMTCNSVHIICTEAGGSPCTRVNKSCFGSGCKLDWDYTCLL